MTQLFSATFEAGDLSEWTGSTLSGAGAVLEVIAGAADTGSYGLHAAVTGATGGNAWAYKTINWPVSAKWYAVVRLRPTAAINSSTENRKITFRTEAPVYNDVCYICTGSSAGGWALVVLGRDGTPVGTNFSTDPSVNNWHTLKLMFDCSGTDPVATVWLDGTQVATYTDSSSGTVRTPTSLRVGVRETAYTAGADDYFDNVTVDDADPDAGGEAIACEGASAGTSTATASLSGTTAALAGTSTAAATASATRLESTKPVASAVSASAAVSATRLESTKPASGSAAGTSAASGRLSNIAALAGQSAGVATVSATGLLSADALVGQSAGTSTATGALQSIDALSATVAGTSTATADLTISTPGAVALSGQADGTSAVSGALGSAKPLANAAPAPLLINGGFETAGAGGDDVWTNWIEDKQDGAIADETTLTHSGGHAAKLTQGAALATDIRTINYTVVADTAYTFQFWTRGDGTNAGRYGVYDVTHSAEIVTSTTTGIAGTAYALFTATFTTPADCTSIRFYLKPAATDGAIAYFDDVSFERVDSIRGAAAVTGTLGNTKALAVSAAGAATVSGALSVDRSLGGSVAGTSGVTANLQRALALTGSVAGASSVVGAIGVPKALTGQSDGTGAASGTLGVVALSLTELGTSMSAGNKLMATGSLMRSVR